ncbi:MAG TPA: xanthine dehydrogenase family protein subunit M, partial [Ktedonobacteraceae bacterium]|nr:xanthine dehydrogenase family protein subunit M [Ktedonobacteraceae bacterium]
MKPPKFRYFAPKSVGEALALLEEHAAEARVLAGGQSLVPLMNMRLVHPEVLIDINGISELSFIEAMSDGLAIGALTRDATLAAEKHVAEGLSVLNEAAHFVGHPAIRNRSTVGGSIAHADPAAELPAVMIALNAEMVARSRTGSRTITSNAFFKGYLTTDLKDGEMLTEVRIPGLPARSGSTFVEFARREGDYALAGVAAVVTLHENGTIADARLGLCSVGPAPVRPHDAEALLRGQRPGDEAWAAAANAVISVINEPLSDIHGSANYRRHLARVL